MARSFLCHIRVDSKAELVRRIYQGIAEINEAPVVFRWRYKMNHCCLTVYPTIKAVEKWVLENQEASIAQSNCAVQRD